MSESLRSKGIHKKELELYQWMIERKYAGGISYEDMYILSKHYLTGGLFDSINSHVGFKDWDKEHIRNHYKAYLKDQAFKTLFDRFEFLNDKLNQLHDLWVNSPTESTGEEHRLRTAIGEEVKSLLFKLRERATQIIKQEVGV